jgi:hypothetical protein
LGATIARPWDRLHILGMSGERQSWRAPLLVGLLVLALAVLRVLAVWDELPRRMASHFGLNGHPDAWTSRGRFFATYALIVVGVVGLLLLLPWLLRSLPAAFVNIPHRHYWLAPERRSFTLGKLAWLLRWVALAVALLLFGILELTLRANLDRAPLGTGSWWILGAFLAFMTAWVLVLLRTFGRPDA